MIIFFDIETASIYDKDNRNIWDLKDKHWDKLNFMPEFNKIITICIWYKENWNLIIKNLEWTEKEQITQFFELAESNDLCWFNIKKFDLPFIIKRAIHLKKQIPYSLRIEWKKPREINNIIDLQEVYSYWVYWSIWNLDLICNFLWIKSPKDEWIKWSDVQEFYDNWKIEDIIEYCKRDVKATIEVYTYFKWFNLF